MLRIDPDFTDQDNPVTVHDEILAALLRVPVFPGTPTPVLPITVVVPHTVMHTLTYCAYPHDNVSERVLYQMMIDVYRERWGLHAFASDDDEYIAEAKEDEALIELLRSHPSAVARPGTKSITWPKSDEALPE